MSHEQPDIYVGDTGSLQIQRSIYDIRSLIEDDDDCSYSDCFYLCNITWRLRAEKCTDNNGVPYLSIFLEKVDDDYENFYSCHVQMALTLFSYNAKYNVTFDLQEIGSPNSRYVFGTRDGEGSAWGRRSFVPWNNLLNPRWGFMESDEDFIQVGLDMTILKIMKHWDDCVCPSC